MSDDDAEPGRPADEHRYRHLIEHIHDAVVEFDIVDGDPVVRDVNSAFEDVFGYAADDLRGDSLNEWIVPEWLREEAAGLDDRTAAGEINYRRVRRETADGLREFLYRGIPYEAGSRTSGYAVYTDLTEITRTERRLEVLNRVLRHNLRNTANVIVGSTAQLLDEFDEQSAERTRVAATVERAAADLERLTREAGDIEAVLDGPDVDDAAVDCVPLIRDVVAEYRETAPRATIETDLPASLPVRGTGDLRLAVESLVDNAVEHNPGDAPRVGVRATEAAADGWATIRVDDDAPRIPADERAVLADDAEITPTRHGTGLGLWLVKWTVESFGGELTFARSDLGGNSVRLRLPRA